MYDNFVPVKELEEALQEINYSDSKDTGYIEVSGVVGYVRYGVDSNRVYVQLKKTKEKIP